MSAICQLKSTQLLDVDLEHDVPVQFSVWTLAKTKTCHMMVDIYCSKMTWNT